MYVVKLERIEKDHRSIGIKGFSLGRMVREGLPVPPGFVLTAEAFENFLKANKIKNRIAGMLKGINYGDDSSLREASEHMRAMIKEAQLPDYIESEVKQNYEELSVGREVREIGGAALDLIKAGRGQSFVSVRSSPTVADYSPGQLKTILNVQGSELSEAIKICWSSLFSERALLFRKQRRMSEFPIMAVIIQKMLDADKAGVVFTAQPERNDNTRLVIESSWGLGESIIQGLVTPDEYVLDKSNGSVTQKSIRKKMWLFTRDQLSGKTVRQTVSQEKMEGESLNEAELKKIWSLTRRIEEIYNSQPQMIEWCEERNRLFVLGTRRLEMGRWAAHLNSGEQEPEGKLLHRGTGVSPGRARGKVRILSSPEDMDSVQQGTVVVTRTVDPAMIPAIAKASALVTDEGGRFSIAASVAGEFGIPCVVGLEKATSSLFNDQEVLVDGTGGRIYEAQAPPQQNFQNHNVFQSAPLFPQQGIPQRYEGNLQDDFTATTIKAILSFATSAASASDKADGALLKVEYILTEGGIHPENIAKTNPEQLIGNIVRGVEKVAKSFYPKPVWYRSLDATSDIFKQLGGYMEPEEGNPIMGWHGIRRSLDRQDVFRCELEALRRLHQSGLNNISLILPFVSKLDELTKVKQMIDFPMKMGILVETPAVALNIESFCKEGLDFVSIDSGTLAQLTLGVDRNNMQIYRLYSETDPAVTSLIKHVVVTCKKYGVETSIQGEVVNNPEIIETLIKLGINSIATEIDTIEHIKSLVSRTERRLLLDRVRRERNF